jgi:hypothetical protein
MHGPAAVGLFGGDAGFAGVEQADGGIDGVAHFTGGRGGEEVTALPGSIDYTGKGVGHGISLQLIS